MLLEDQDRARWDHEMIDEGVAVLDGAIGLAAPGPYQLQAAIAALHAQAPRPDDTDWPQIASLYGALAADHAEPRGRAEPRRGGGDGRRARRPGCRWSTRSPATSTSYHLFHAARADLLRRLERREEAGAAYRRALELVTNPAERDFLERRLAEL